MPSASFSKKANSCLVLSQLYKREHMLGLECHKQDDASANQHDKNAGQNDQQKHITTGRV